MLPKVHLINGSVFITYKGVCYTEEAFKGCEPEIYDLMFSGRLKKVAHNEYEPEECYA